MINGKAVCTVGRFSGAESKAETAKNAGGLFPLTPTLSLEERENHSPVF